MRRTRAWAIGAVVTAAGLAGLCGPHSRTAAAAELSPEVLWDGGGEGGRDGCLRAGGRIVEMPVAHVRPFRLGGARDAADAVAASPTRSSLCVFGALTPDVTLVTGSTWRVAASESVVGADGVAPEAPFGGRCAEECDASLTLLTEADREALIALPGQVRDALGERAAAPPSGDGGARVAWNAAKALAGLSHEGDAAAPLDVSVGDVDCTWRRFRAGRLEAEPTERCRIGRDRNGMPTVEQLSGKALEVRLEPLTDQVSVYLGRLRGADEPRGDYDREEAGPAVGNRSGLALLMGNQIHLVSADRNEGVAVLTLSGN